MAKQPTTQIHLPSISALAQLFFTAASGKEPDSDVREAAIQQWQQVTVSPWLDTDAPHTHLYGELFFTELQVLQQSNDLIDSFRASREHLFLEGNATSDEILLKAQIENAGYELEQTLTVSEQAWKNYYEPLEQRLAEISSKMTGSQAVMDIQREVNLYKSHLGEFSYQFFIAKKR